MGEIGLWFLGTQENKKGGGERNGGDQQMTTGLHEKAAPQFIPVEGRLDGPKGGVHGKCKTNPIPRKPRTITYLPGKRRIRRTNPIHGARGVPNEPTDFKSV